MKMSKVILPIFATAAAIGTVSYVVKKRKFSKSFKVASDIAQVVYDAAEKSFVELKQSVIDEIVSNTYKGEKAVIDGKTLEYIFRSASGKSTGSAKFELDDSAGKIVCTFLSHPDAKSPRFFIENLIAAMKANGER